MEDPFKTFDEIRQAFLRYLDSPFRLRYQALNEERRALFDRDRQLYRDPLFEPIVPYESSGLTIHDACARLGVHADAGEFIGRGLFPSDRTLYQHQFEVGGVASRQRSRRDLGDQLWQDRVLSHPSLRQPRRRVGQSVGYARATSSCVVGTRWPRRATAAARPRAASSSSRAARAVPVPTERPHRGPAWPDPTRLRCTRAARVDGDE